MTKQELKKEYLELLNGYNNDTHSFWDLWDFLEDNIIDIKTLKEMNKYDEKGEAGNCLDFAMQQWEKESKKSIIELNEKQIETIKEIVEKWTHWTYIGFGSFIHIDEQTGDIQKDLINKTTIQFKNVNDFEKWFSFKDDVIENLKGVE